jgi:alkylhydroperoxidase/carboxymuconolactone decarboxylase family protein YurZ
MSRDPSLATNASQPCRSEPILTLDEIHRQVEVLLADTEEGEPLSVRDRALINLAVHVSPATLDLSASEHYARLAIDAGASGAQIHEVLLLVSGLGVHTLLTGSPRMGALLLERGDPLMTTPLDEERLALLARYVGDDPYWEAMELEFPGFIDSLLRLSPVGFKAFFDYCAVPWTTAALRAITKELISLAVDATPSHRFMPGLRLHVRNAIKLGASANALRQTLALAAESSLHRGVC